MAPPAMVAATPGPPPLVTAAISLMVSGCSWPNLRVVSGGSLTCTGPYRAWARATRAEITSTLKDIADFPVVLSFNRNRRARR
jgi:hypothetical protein